MSMHLQQIRFNQLLNPYHALKWIGALLIYENEIEVCREECICVNLCFHTLRRSPLVSSRTREVQAANCLGFHVVGSHWSVESSWDHGSLSLCESQNVWLVFHQRKEYRTILYIVSEVRKPGSSSMFPESADPRLKCLVTEQIYRK